MKYILARLFAVLQREIDAYERLQHSIELEKQCLLTRELPTLHATLELQKRIVHEIHELEKDQREEWPNLAVYLIANGYGTADSIEEMVAVLPLHYRRRLTVLRERLKRQILRTRQLNHENLRVVTVSRHVFGDYLQNLANLCASAGGYRPQGQAQGTTGGAILDQKT